MAKGRVPAALKSHQFKKGQKPPASKGGKKKGGGKMPASVLAGFKKKR